LPPLLRHGIETLSDGAPSLPRRHRAGGGGRGGAAARRV